MIKDNIFREYDIRGIYNTEINEDVAYIIGRGFASYIRNMNEDITIVGHDNRLSSPNLYNALIKGITDSGVNVVSLSLVTTPMYYFAKLFFNINTGIMLTASHNPTEYNGFKISFSKEGNAYGKQIEDFKQFIKNNDFYNGLGNVIEKDIRQEYINLLTSNILLPKKLKVVVDCGNGTGSIIIKDILDRLNVEYYLLYCDSDGSFPNHHPDPSVSENLNVLSKKVVELGYDLGIGIDGDADRVGLVDELGNIIKTDYYLIVMYKYLYPNLKNKSCLYDVKCSRSLIDEMNKLGLNKTMYRTGNSYIHMMMQKGNFDFGGEYSGHIYFRDKFPGFDDGIYSGIRMLELLSNKNTTLSKELEDINRYFSTEEIKIKTDDVKKFEIVDKVKSYCEEKKYNIIEIDGVRVEFEDSWALIRVSNTTPCLTLRFEAITSDRLNEIKEEFTNLINSLL